MRRTCEVCSGPFDSNRSHAKYCGATCRQRARRGGQRESSAPLAEYEGEDLVVSVRAEVTSAGLAGQPLGSLAVLLAERASGPGEMGSSVASLAKQLREVLDEIRARSGDGEFDPIDEVRRRRDEKRAG